MYMPKTNTTLRHVIYSFPHSAEQNSKTIAVPPERVLESKRMRSKCQRSPITLISNVHTLLIHTLSLPSTPSTFVNSTPSHQHLRAGFRQNSNNFCAMPTALLPISFPRTSVRNRARARLQITALLGSPARCPHRSSWLKPLL